MQIKLYLLKLIAIAAFTLSAANANSQSLKNTEWTRILAENTVEGETIVNPKSSNEIVKYFFLDDSVLISTNESYSNKLPYSISEGVLSIGSYVRYKIDSLSEQFLIISDNPVKVVKSANPGTFTFINTDFVFDYLEQTRQITIIGDSVIIASKLFSPIYNGDITTIFSNGLSEFTHATYTGSFTISKDEYIRDVQVSSHKKGTKQDIIRIGNILISTKGAWLMPPTPRPFDCKVNFSISISGIENFTAIGIILHPEDK